MNDSKPGERKHQKPRSFATMTSDEYITERLNPMRAWYDKKAYTAKRAHQITRLLIVLGGAHVPVLINLETTKVISTCLSLLVVILIAIESVFHFREQWKAFRSTEQLLTREYIHFATGQGHYAQSTTEQAFPIFVKHIESILTTEHNTTIKLMTEPQQQTSAVSSANTL